MATWIVETGDETLEEIVERIAKARHEAPCPAEEQPFCNPELHVWENAHELDKEWGREAVRFFLEEMGFVE